MNGWLQIEPIKHELNFDRFFKEFDKMTHEERKKKLKELREEVSRLKKECPHEVAAIKKPNKFGCYGAAICMGCGEDFGWYCPDSPDHVCHYYSRKGMVDLLDNSQVHVPESHDSKYETDDSCIFCGHPEERK